MPREKRSFFERLTGSVSVDEEYEDMLEDANAHVAAEQPAEAPEESGEGQLTVDVYQTDTDIFIKTMVAGVNPSDLDVSITRDMVTIRGKREEEETVSDDNFVHRELYWGSFSRTILLPQEIDVEEAEAMERHGLLILKLPKIDKSRQTKLKIKSN